VGYPSGGTGDGEDRGGRLGRHPGDVAKRAKREVNVRRGRRAVPGPLDEVTVSLGRDGANGLEQRGRTGIAATVDRVAEPGA
jgi:hypothetical protein